jgi:hypothetical protein
MIKATEGTTYIDGLHNISYEALNGKIPIGFYHYLTSTSEPETQAQNFWEHIKDKQYQIIPCLDVEHDSLSDNAESYSVRFLQEFRNLSGQEMIIYSGRCYIEEHFSNSFKQAHNWWVADYSANECPSIGGCNIIAWQYSEDSSYAFAMGEVDSSELEDEQYFFIENQIPYSEKPLEMDYNSSVESLQKELKKQGYRDRYGNDLVVDGIAGELTLSACPIVSSGARGLITQWIQIQVETTSDGIFGEQTKQAVITYQENKSLDGDGIVGQETWRKLIGL